MLFVVCGFLPSLRSRVVAVFSDNTTALAYRQEAGRYSLFYDQCGGSDGPSPLRDFRHLSPSPVHPGRVECPRGFSELLEPGHRLRVDPLFGGFLAASSPVASHSRSVCHGPQSPSPCVIFSYGGPTVSWHRCHAPELGWPPGLRLPSLWPHLSGLGEGPAVSGAGADLGGSVLATAPLVPGPSELLVAVPLSLPRKGDLLRQPHFHHFHQNLPVLQLTAWRISSDRHAMPDSLRR